MIKVKRLTREYKNQQRRMQCAYILQSLNLNKKQ